MNDMRTPLGKVRGLGSAKEGTGHFWFQRMSAVALVPLVLFFIGLVISLHGASYAEVKAALAHPFTALVMALFVLTGVYHMRLGMQVIIEDYIHGEGMKVLLVMLNTFFTVVVGVACVYAILKLSFGG
ncbi:MULTISPECIES: succinate dehydrogenase, hydrophobic membrane anchor protein [Ochrobactrum]|uniref:Succinate dehydrogenase hydrophobic membrane anchor subunit n=1 Tax=Ochrobactrum chromiisoli TaxID=2993941 RepID=A0ABT3QHY7_9HYPH|nr:succinate dehydrogenase, hydrophobic membrane anchor protein [Ochrobactrum chromiisoli]MCX2695222.1 succinate dehydrogenase, hydrophobic membrane anchor protein [Ochrobactrum chromiisoli]